MVQQPETNQDTWKKVSYVPTDVLPVHLQKGGHPLPSSTHAHSCGFPDGLLGGHHEVDGAFDGEVSAHDLQRDEKQERSHHCSAQLFRAQSRLEGILSSVACRPFTTLLLSVPCYLHGRRLSLRSASAPMVSADMQSLPPSSHSHTCTQVHTHTHTHIMESAPCTACLKASHSSEPPAAC